MVSQEEKEYQKKLFEAWDSINIMLKFIDNEGLLQQFKEFEKSNK